LKAIVIYDSKYGNTEKVAVALSEGLKSDNLETECIKVQNVDVAKVDLYDFLARAKVQKRIHP
jgi:flavodoxin